jgi:hypothetical protein
MRIQREREKSVLFWVVMLCFEEIVVCIFIQIEIDIFTTVRT